MDDNAGKLLPWLLLQQIPCLSLSRIESLLQHFHDPQSLLSAEGEDLAALPQAVQNAIRELQDKGENHACHQQAMQQLAMADELDVHIVTRASELYPPLLKQIQRPPPVLYVKGDVLALSANQLAVVGARKATAPALSIARQWSAALAGAGLGIASGLALGVDGHAHQGALEGGGTTVAVLAHGMDQLYPYQHRQLADEITRHGALVSEFPFGMPARREHFPQRNRIIAGISLGVLVVEAALRSGSLITARLALEENREVLAVPGSINNVMARGCHRLIKQGATLVENADDILQALALPLSFAISEQASDGQQTEPLPVDGRAATVLEAVDFAPTHIEKLVAATGLDAAAVSSELTLLELDGHVANVDGRYQRLT